MIYGTNVTLSVNVTNTGCSLPLTYQWSLDGRYVFSSTSNYTLAFASALTNTGVYSVIVSNLAGATNASWTVKVIGEGSPVWWGGGVTQTLDFLAGTNDVTDLAAGLNHDVLVRENGSVLAWGANTYAQTNVPATATNVMAVAAGDNHSLALKSDGSVLAWGRNNSNQTNVPTNATNVIAIAAGGDQSLALKTNGTVVQWGATNAAVPASVVNVTAIASGTNFHLALLSNATVVAWGNNGNGQTNVPANLSNVVAIAAGGAHALALKTDGAIVAWGSNGAGETNVPSGLTNAMGVAAGYAHSVALRNDGTVIGWGDNTYGQTNVGGGLTPIKSIASGGNHSLATVFSSLVQYPVEVAKDLLLIYNTNSADSLVVKDYYLAHRPMVSGANVLGIACPTSYGCPTNETALPNEYTNQIANPVLNWLSANPTKHPQYVILFPDIPARVNEFNQIDTNGFRYYSNTNVHDSVSVQLRDAFTGWKPFVTHLNMGDTNACKAYIDKLEFFGTNYSPGKVIISASAGGYGNTTYAVDNVRHQPYATSISVSVATNGLLQSGVPQSAIQYLDGIEIGTNVLSHIASGTNVAGYVSWGFHSSLGTQYATTNGLVKWHGSSGWYVIQTKESHNGLRFSDSGYFLQWFASDAFGGTNYSNTPVAAASYVDEPNLPANYSDTFFGQWAGGKIFSACAWNSVATTYFQAVGDPFVTK